MPRWATGIPGLDDVLMGGLPAERMYLVHGLPGSGKTTLALQFLLEGVRLGERVLYISLSETEAEIRQFARSHGWDLDGVTIYELANAESLLDRNDNTLYATEDVELRETIGVMLAEVERLRPSRVVFDSLSEIRLLSQTGNLYRREILALKRFFAGRHCTVLLLDDRSGLDVDAQVESIVHGVVALEHTPRPYGGDRRRLRIVKLRGATFRSGFHDIVIEHRGLVIFPRLVAREHRRSVGSEALSSDISELDLMLGGGVDRSTSTLVIGPAGSGKSAIAAQFASAAASRGEHAAIFLFEERLRTLLARSTQLGLPLEAQLDAGTLDVRQVDPAELAPDELAHLVRQTVETKGTKLVVIDGINGYFAAMPEERFMTLHMHELLGFLAERGVATIMTMAQAGVGAATSPIDVSYLSDSIVLLRHFESGGRVRKAVSVLKKRSGWHEDTVRELSLERTGIRVGDPLSRMRGVLTGVPSLDGSAEKDPERALQ